jgi:hypothetical protein
MFDSEKDFARNVSNLISHLNHEKKRGDFLRKVIRKHGHEPVLKGVITTYLDGLDGASQINAKQFVYTSSIISLYGYLESFLENITREFIQNLNQSNMPFSSLPNNIRRFHLELSIDLLKKVRRSKGIAESHKNDQIKLVLKHMHTCAEEQEGYQLNEDAFSLHSANFRYDSIHEYFARVGVESMPRLALQGQKLREAIAGKYSIDSNTKGNVFRSLLKNELDDLAQRRNEISHGSFDGELESIDLVIERALCLKEFGASVSNVLTNHYFETVFHSAPNIKLGSPTKIFVRDRVFGFFANPNHNDGISSSICVGDSIFARNDSSNEKLMYGKVISIAKNRESSHSIQIPSDTEFTLKVDFSFNSHMDNRGIYVINRSSNSTNVI